MFDTVEVNTLSSIYEHVRVAFRTCWYAHTTKPAMRCVRCDGTCVTATLHKADGKAHQLSADGALSHVRNRVCGLPACRSQACVDTLWKT
jgi:hypothetical protein